MSRARDLANLGNNASGLETLTVSDITDLSVSASNINSATNQITDSSTDLNVDSNTLVVDKSANAVGIGTTSPDAKLTLDVPSYDSSSTNGMIRFQNSNNTSDACVQSYYVAGEGAEILLGTNAFINTSGSHDRFDNTNETSSIYIRRDGTIRFSTNGTGGVGQERMRIDSAGQIGIGGIQPTSALDITGANNGASSINLKNTAPNPDSHWQITPSYASDTLQFRSANNSYAARLEVYAGGGIGVNGGNIVIGTTGKGIDFSQQTTSSRTGVTPDTSAGAEVLDHYEEGTWLPVMESNGAQPVVTYNNRFGTYIRIGNRVIAEFGVNITVNTAHGGVTAIDTAGLPFSPKSETLYEYSTGGYCLRSKASNEEAIFFNNHNPASATRLYFMERESTSGSQIQSGVYSGVIIYRTS